MRLTALALAITLLAGPLVHAATVDPPQRVTVLKLDRTEIAGLITSFNDDGFELMDAKKQTQRVRWDDLHYAGTFGDDALYLVLGGTVAPDARHRYPTISPRPISPLNARWNWCGPRRRDRARWASIRRPARTCM